MTLVTVLCIRDPDASNEYVTDGEVRNVTIDVGGSWSGYGDFAACLREGQEDALEYERAIKAEVDDLPQGNAVRAAVDEFFETARADG